MGSQPHVVDDLGGILHIFSDGSIWRRPFKDINFGPIRFIDDSSVIFKDITYDQNLNLSLRLYKPRLTNPTSSAAKLPVVLYFHGGGFCVGSRVWPHYRNVCVRLAAELKALVVSPDHRLAPEHKLPAALDDAACVVDWLQGEALMSESGGDCDAWIRGGVVDFDRVFIVGDSSGGTIAHHLAVSLGGGSVKAAPLRVRGYVLVAPFFGGVEWTKSEQEPHEPRLTLDVVERLWRLSLPEGATRDHPLANPFGPNSPRLETVDLDPILVIVGGDEMLKDRSVMYWSKLKELGKKIEYAEFDGEQHGFFSINPYSDVANEAFHVVKRFVNENSN
ncbi:carboxylesterase 15-like [Rosa rugosa]|uniref:carboxylesterase 15-like n=1 Tax=Rosa rugosa TaxID=74645 RepID=UPI002B402B29|nr:carboxylesterase 15-like [Rosa rugosa]